MLRRFLARPKPEVAMKEERGLQNSRQVAEVLEASGEHQLIEFKQPDGIKNTLVLTSPGGRPT